MKKRKNLEPLFASTKALGLLGIIISFYFSSLSYAVSTAEKSTMDKAREFYGNGELDRALTEYEKIPQKSDFWIEAIEEKAWIYLRKNQTDKTLALTTTLSSELLAPQVGPEVYYLKALTDYRLCHIKGVFQDFELFKKRMKSRSDALKKLSQGQFDPELFSKVMGVIQKYQNKISDIKADHFGLNMHKLPRYFYRDNEFLSAAKSEMKGLMIERMKLLADDDDKEISQTLKKLQLLEAQLIQQVHAYQKEMEKKRKATFAGKKDDDQLIFALPGQDDPWLDELDKIEAATSDCPIDPLKESRL